jgi:hypothetical protein
MEGPSRYSELVDKVVQVEKESAKPDVDFVDTSAISQEEAQAEAQKIRTYAEFISFIESIEGKAIIPRRVMEVGKPQTPQAQVQTQQQVPSSPQLIAAGVTQTMHAMGETAPRAQAQQESVKRQKLAVAQELSELAGKLSSIKAPLSALTRKRINVKDLVLPSLSIPDQVSELERIIEGLHENVFDSEHLEIVRQEVYGLEQVTEDGRAAVKRGKVQLTSLDQSMWTLRDQRLVDAMSLLKDAKGRVPQDAGANASSSSSTGAS